ncbi:MAG: translation initiation factor IF-5A [Candidatus Aenigmarchaeota archaeon]|nr:translation initiation factor IF-5A [Candidatus Aenigmarchaeota archaeon]
MDKTTSVIKNLKKGSFVLIDDVPCKVIDISVTKSGKHGASKTRVEGIGLFDGRRKSIVKPSDDTVDVPIITKKKAQVLAISGEKVQLMDLSDYSMFELDIPEELKGKLNSGDEVNYFEIVGIRTLKPLK